MVYVFLKGISLLLGKVALTSDRVHIVFHFTNALVENHYFILVALSELIHLDLCPANRDLR